MKTYIHTYIILTCVVICASLSASEFQTLEHLKSLTQLKSAQLTEKDMMQASLNNPKALVAARYIDLDFDALSIIQGKDQSEFINLKNKNISGHYLTVDVPDMVKPLILFVENVQNLIPEENITTYTGYVVTSKNQNNFFTLSMQENFLMAKINFGEFLYIITPLESDDNKHALVKFKKSLMVRDTEDDVIEKSKKNVNYVEKSKKGAGNVRILFYFEPGVWTTLYATLSIAEMNAALNRSGVSPNNYLSIAGTKMLNTPFTGLCKLSILYKMLFRNNQFTNIDTDLISYGADIAVTFVKANTGQDCGFVNSFGIYGRVGGIAQSFVANDPFAVIADTYALGDLTSLHEIGHILGGAHAKLTANSYQGLFPYSQGYMHEDHINPNNSWQTIMGSYGDGNDDCEFQGVYSSCERINYFSNPDSIITYNNIQMSTGTAARNMKLSLENSMPIVSGWRGNPVQIPQAPFLSATSAQCYGLNYVSWWTQQSTITEFKLYKSFNINFTSPTLIYNGQNTQTNINILAFGTKYLRIKACNSAGCSAYSNQVPVDRYPTCN